MAKEEIERYFEQNQIWIIVYALYQVAKNKNNKQELIHTSEIYDFIKEEEGFKSISHYKVKFKYKNPEPSIRTKLIYNNNYYESSKRKNTKNFFKKELDEEGKPIKDGLWNLNYKNEEIKEFIKIIDKNNIFIKEQEIKNDELESSEYVTVRTKDNAVIYLKKQIKRSKKLRDEYLNTLKVKTKCEYCKKETFVTLNDDYYLEVHHINFLSVDGKDELNNMIALCPECHKKAHFSKEIDELKKEFKTYKEKIN